MSATDMTHWMCDRCGKTTQRSYVTPGAEHVWRRPMPNDWGRLKRPEGREYDLCPACVESFDRWHETDDHTEER